MDNFINSIENIYQIMNIHRAIIIINNINNLSIIINRLKENNHNPIIINEKSRVNYNYKLFIIENEKLLYKFNKNKYNLIIIY